jgi:hypothetical protein
LWYAPPGLAGVEDPASVAPPSLASLSLYAMRNVAAAALALDTGNAAAAVTRGREILAVGRHLVRDPVPAIHQRGLGLVALGARVLAQVALIAGDPAVGREAADLQDALERRRAELLLFSSRAAGLAMSAADSSALALMGDTTRAPADRWALLSGMATGFCWNGKEILLGASPERIARLREAGEHAADIPRTGDWVELNARWLPRLSGVGGTRIRVLGAPARAALCGSLRGSPGERAGERRQ